MNKTKSYEIPKQTVVEAFFKVKANKGAAGIDGQTIEDFESDLKNNLYKIWNRMSSGSYLPPAVKATDDAPLRGSFCPFLDRSIRHLKGCFKPSLDIQDDPWIICVFPNGFHEQFVVNIVKQPLNVA